MKVAKIALLMLFVPVIALGMTDPGVPDTLRIGSASCLPGRSCTVPIYLTNDEYLFGLEIVLGYQPENLIIDSFSLQGGLLESFESPFVSEFVDSANLMNFAFIPDVVSDSIPPGENLLGNLHFTAMPAAGGLTVPIENAVWPKVIGGDKITMLLLSPSEFITPNFIPGEVTIPVAPPSPDSIWVDKVVGIPGQSVAVNVNAYNVENISSINLALQVSSTDLIYSSTSFTGTRGDIAYTKQAAINGQQLLISLIFDESTPLPPGSGSLARILFNIDPSADEGIVTIDSATYLDVQSTEFILTENDGNASFTPYFTAGQVEIKWPTDLEDIQTEVLPTSFALGQNVPNPFNPATRISFDLPRASEVQLDVFNILGQKVRTLVDDYLPAGTHEVIFDGRGDQYQILASGVYFYRLEAGEFRQSLKMTLMK